MVLQAMEKCHFSMSHPDTQYRSEEISPPSAQRRSDQFMSVHSLEPVVISDQIGDEEKKEKSLID